MRGRGRREGGREGGREGAECCRGAGGGFADAANKDTFTTHKGMLLAAAGSGVPFKDPHKAV